MLVFNLFVLHIGLPVFLIGWLLWRPARSRARWGAEAFFFTGVVATILMLGGWSWFGYPLRLLIAGLLLWALVVSYRRARTSPTRRKRSRFDRLEIGMRLGLGVGVWGILVYALTALIPPSDAVDLAFPLGRGTYIVSQGGNGPVTNVHHRHPSQRYAYDILKLNRLGMRARGFYPSDPRRYAIWGDPVLSPCAGTVVLTRNDRPDREPPRRDPEDPPGNVVAIECRGLVVYLAHLMEGSIRVRPGDVVHVGQVLGRVGNSGNTTEPHLHIHAERGAFDGINSGAPAVPIRLAGRFLIRNSLVRSAD